MSIRNSDPKAADDAGRQPGAAEAWRPDNPVPYSLTPFAEAAPALDDPGVEASTWCPPSALPPAPALSRTAKRAMRAGTHLPEDQERRYL